MSNENRNIIKALLQVQGEIQNPKKTEQNPYFKSKYAPLDQILNDIRTLLTRHGLVLLQDTGATEDGAVTVQTTLLHESGEWICTETLTLHPQHRGEGRSTPQEMGSAITYARRYQLMSLLNIAGEDDDGNGASKKPRQRPQPKPKRQESQVEVIKMTPPEERFKGHVEIMEIIELLKADGEEVTDAKINEKARELMGEGRLTANEFIEIKKALGGEN